MEYLLMKIHYHRSVLVLLQSLQNLDKQDNISRMAAQEACKFQIPKVFSIPRSHLFSIQPKRMEVSAHNKMVT
jgi:hypothetical protein